MSDAKIVVEISKEDITVEGFNGDNELDNLLVELLTLRISDVITKTLKDIEENKTKVIH